MQKQEWGDEIRCNSIMHSGDFTISRKRLRYTMKREREQIDKDFSKERKRGLMQGSCDTEVLSDYRQ